jgi:hypothetical protein
MPEVQEAIKTGLFECLYFEKDQKMKTHIAETLG